MLLIITRDLCTEYGYNYYRPVIKRQAMKEKKGWRIQTGSSQEENIWIANEPTKLYSVFLGIWKMQMKTTIRCYYTPLGLAKCGSLDKYYMLGGYRIDSANGYINW